MSGKKLELVYKLPIRFVFCGYFRAPSKEWAHISRSLGEYELMMVREGTLYIADEENRYEVSAGEYVIMRPTSHQYGYQTSYCEFYWLHFVLEDGVVKDNKIEEIMNIPLYGKLANRNRAYQLAEQTAEIERAYHDKTQAAYSLMSLLCEIEKQMESSYPNRGNQPDLICQSVKEYIDSNQMSKLSVKEIAEYAGYHEKYLSFLFHRQTGKVLKTYMIESKMKYACELLLGTNETVAQIGYHLGYSDAHNFSTAFRKKIGVSPGEFRKKNRTDS